MKKLSFKYDAEIICYLYYAFPLGVILADDDEQYKNWLFNNFIQLKYDPSSSQWFDFGESNYLFWPILDCSKIDGKSFYNYYNDVNDYIITSINNEYYVDLSIDEYYIKGKANYLLNHISHQILIYGYDNINKEYYAVSYLSDGHYRQFMVSFDAIKIATSQIEYFKRIIIFKKNKTFFKDGIEIDLKLICRNLNGYLKSTNISNSYLSYVSNQQDVLFGLQAENLLIEHLLGHYQSERCLLRLDIRAVYVFYEHKKCMLNRLKYLNGTILLNKIDKICVDYEVIYRKSNLLLMLSLKFILTEKDAIMIRSADLCKSILQDEKIILNNLIQIINVEII